MNRNDIQQGTVLKIKQGQYMQGQHIPFWIVHAIYETNDYFLVELRQYDPNNKEITSVGLTRTLAQLNNEFTWYRQDEGGKKRRSLKSRKGRKSRRTKRVKRFKRH